MTQNTHIHRLLVHGERNGRVFGEKHAPRVAEIGHDEMGRRDERQNAGTATRVLHDNGSRPLPLPVSPVPYQNQCSSASEERPTARARKTSDSVESTAKQNRDLPLLPVSRETNGNDPRWI